MTKADEKITQKDERNDEREFVPLRETQWYKKSLEFEKTLSAEEIRQIKKEINEEIGQDFYEL